MRRFMWLKLFGLFALIIIGISVFDRAVFGFPTDVTVEEVRDYGALPQIPITNPFEQPAATEPVGDELSEALKHPSDETQKSQIDSSWLAKFNGPDRQLLLRHLATSAKWYLGRTSLGGPQALVAWRRQPLGGMWHNSIFGDVCSQEGTAERFWKFTIMLGIDGLNGYELPNTERTWITSNGATLGICQDAPLKQNQFTSLAESQVQGELQAVLGSRIAHEQGFDPSLMPNESIRRGEPEMHLIGYSEAGNAHQVYAYINPQEGGFVYIKSFQGQWPIRISDGPPAGSVEYTGWSADPHQQVLYNTEVEINPMSFPGDDVVVKLELWFVPDSGKPERKLIERYF